MKHSAVLLTALLTFLAATEAKTVRPIQFQGTTPYGEVIRITCGSPPIQDGLISDKMEWITSERTYTKMVNESKFVRGSKQKIMARSARYARGDKLSYRINVGEGRFSVKLFFAEIMEDAGKRVFDVRVNGKEVKGYDLMKVAGARYNTTKLFFGAIFSKQIEIDISRVQGDPILNGIVITKKTSRPSPRPTPGRTPPPERTPAPTPEKTPKPERTPAPTPEKTPTPERTPVPTPEKTPKPERTPAPTPSKAPKPSSGPPPPPPKGVTFPVWTQGPSGKAQDFGKAPKAGVHPRLFFGPERLPELRRLLLKSGAKCNDELCHDPVADVPGAAAYLYLKMRILTGRYNTPMMDGSSKFSELFDRLKVGDTSNAALNALKDLGGDIGHTQAAKGNAGYNGMYGLLAGAGFVGLVEENADMFDRKELSTALSSMCILHKKFYVQNNNGRFHHDAQVDLGIAYDYMGAYMTEAQKKPCRELIMMMIRDRVEIGQDGYLGAPWRTNWNHIGWHEHIVVLALSIYGEPGTDGEPERFLEQCLEVQKAWFFYAPSEGGFGREEIYYFNLGLMWAQPAQLAIARYGDKYNLVQKSFLGKERIYRQLLYHFYTKTIPGKTFTSFSGGNDPPRAQVMWQYFFPNDPLAQYNFQNAYWQELWSDKTLEMASFPVEPIKQFSYKEVAIAKGLPLSWMCRDRGRMIARSSWEDDAMTVDFDMRLDTYRSGHIAPQPNTFYIYALDEPWIIKNDMFSDGYEASSMILVDGKGCSGVEDGAKWMMPGMWNDYKHSEKGMTMGSADAAISYTYESTCLGGTKCVDNPGFKSKDFGLKTDMFYQDWMEEDVGYRLLTLRNPMKYAHRTVNLVRSKPHPFTLVTDDYKKDDEDSHKWTWYVNLPNGRFQTYLDVTMEAESSKTHEVILRRAGSAGEGKGKPRLLVRMLDWEGSVESALAVVSKNVKEMRGGSSMPLTRLMVTTEGKSARFKFFFYAFRQGEALPSTDYNRASGMLTVGLGDETRKIKYSMDASGRTIVTEA